MKVKLWTVLLVSAAYCLSFGLVAGQEGPRSLDDVAEAFEAQLEESRAAFNALMAEIGGEKIPLNEKIDELENELVDIRKEYERILRLRDGRTLDLSNLKAQIEGKKKQNEYLTNVLDEYARNFETQIDISELQRYGDQVTQLQNDALNANRSLSEKFDARLKLLDVSMDRVEDVIGGARFPGSAIDGSGVAYDGHFVLLGPISFFSGDSVDEVGLVQTALNSTEPTLVDVSDEDSESVLETVQESRGELPLDVTLGDAVKMAATKTSIFDEIKQGGAVMYPLLGLAGISLIIALFKYIQISMAQRIGPRRFMQVIHALKERDREGAYERAATIRGPIGKMLRVGVEHYDEPRALLEELMFEHILHARAQLNSFIPFIKITAAAAPLLGLLGTVSGMINTFKLIMVFGTGDASTFSAGISEALITTKWGLIVAIPTLLLAAFLSRKAKAIIDDMEKVGLRFMNSIPSAGGEEENSGVSEERSQEPAGVLASHVSATGGAEEVGNDAESESGDENVTGGASKGSDE
ncbi:MAG: MotA/TolQ/ExbB proton channel family protein [Verrucomicrobiota bacterium]